MDKINIPSKCCTYSAAENISLALMNQAEKLAESILGKVETNGTPEIEVEKLPEFMQEYLSHAVKLTDALPAALITAWLPVIAVNIGNKVSIRSNGKNYFCQIWAILMGPSTTSRKTTCFNLAKATMASYDAKLDQMPVSERLKHSKLINGITKAKMADMLSQDPIKLFWFEEVAEFLKGANATYNAGMREMVMKLYDGNSQTSATMERDTRIIDPAISILGASTQSITECFSSDPEKQSGMLQRFIYCVIPPRKDYRPTLGLDKEDGKMPDYDDKFQLLRELPGKYQIKLEEEAVEQWEMTYSKVIEQLEEDDGLISYADRIYKNVFLSLCSLITIMKSLDDIEKAMQDKDIDAFMNNLKVDSQSVCEALYLCNFYMGNAKPMIEVINEGGKYTTERKIIQLLARQENQTATHSFVMRTLKLKAKEMRQALETLEGWSAVEASIVSPAGQKPTTSYKLLPCAAEF